MQAQAGARDELAQLEAHKAQGVPISLQTTPSRPMVHDIGTPSTPPRAYRLPNGRAVNLQNYKLVLFMQSRCGYCQQFDPMLKTVTGQMGLNVFAYTLDGQGDVSYPNAIPAPAGVIRDLWGEMKPVTPAAFLIDVHTLKTLPLLYGMVDAGTLTQRVNDALSLMDSAVQPNVVEK
ncbi:type-F conjugative transfer system pilin assembly thiol-disulfide isomerase TrbB [Edwardsiella tarda]|uniref:type-F conjugative transfer system pilin assembly thiol-disulfide isomerase TrbB n=1 Tax=Edwardsiella tarda TaxID=636 RepID=UPI0028526A38|nr:type-F conjugative transfer system pilin assembly thiol-disulfide isomerase TrbB [Edwardsiella tarda]